MAMNEAEVEVHQDARVSWLLRGGIAQLQLRPAEALTLISLLFASDGLGRSDPSTERIAGEIGASMATVRGALHRLMARELVLLASPANGRKPAQYVIGEELWRARSD
jgi:hypothetical protein